MKGFGKLQQAMSSGMLKQMAQGGQGMPPGQPGPPPNAGQAFASAVKQAADKAGNLFVDPPGRSAERVLAWTAAGKEVLVDCVLFSPNPLKLARSAGR